MTGDASALLIVVVTAAAGCGGARPEPARRVTATPSVDAEVIAFEPGPDAGPPDPCAVYALAVRGSLGRIARATDTFLDRTGAGTERGARVTQIVALVDAIEAERRVLATIHVGVDAIDAAHAKLDPALGALSSALRVAAAAPDPDAAARARRALVAALQDYGLAVATIQLACPALE